MNEQKMDNTKLLESMKTFVEDKTHENMIEIMKNIRLARVFVPTMIPEDVDMEKIKEEALAGGKPIPMPKGTKFRPCILKNSKDDRFFPIFTDPRQIPEDKVYPAIVSIPFLECAAVANHEKETIKGIAINPFSENILFQQELLEAMIKAEKDLRGRRVMPVSKEQYNLMVRHQIEHIVLPKTLHMKGKEFTDNLESEGEEMLNKIYSRPYDKKVGCPYTEDDFSIMALNINENLEMMRIDLPQKFLAQGISSRLYMTLNPNTGATGYFMIEGGKKKDTYVLAEITKEGKHEIIGDAPGEGTELQSIIDLVSTRDEVSKADEL